MVCGGGGPLSLVGPSFHFGEIPERKKSEPQEKRDTPLLLTYMREKEA